MPPKQPTSMAKPALNIKFDEAAIITPPDNVANIRTVISNFPTIILQINIAISAPPVIAYIVLTIDLYYATPIALAELKLGKYKNRNRVPIKAKM